MEWSSVKNERNRMIKFRFYSEFTIKKKQKNNKTTTSQNKYERVSVDKI